MKLQPLTKVRNEHIAKCLGYSIKNGYSRIKEYGMPPRYASFSKNCLITRSDVRWFPNKIETDDPRTTIRREKRMEKNGSYFKIPDYLKGRFVDKLIEAFPISLELDPKTKKYMGTFHAPIANFKFQADSFNQAIVGCLYEYVRNTGATIQLEGY